MVQGSRYLQNVAPPPLLIQPSIDKTKIKIKLNVLNK